MLSVSSNREEYLKYETGADKLTTVNLSHCPYLKLLTFQWVAESIKQDNQVHLNPSNEPILMSADTMISIFAFIIAASSNHLLYSYLHYARNFSSRNTKDLSNEGYYLCILEAALTLLWEYPEKASKLMQSINDFKKSELSTIKENRENEFFLASFEGIQDCHSSEKEDDEIWYKEDAIKDFIIEQDRQSLTISFGR